MENNPSGNKRIAKNTLLLYFRMLLTILVGLYTSRVVLNTLGRSDYGVYNIVGGVVTMLAFLNSAMVAASQRFISFELGTGDLEKLKKVFAAWIDNGHNDFDDENTIIMRVELTDALLLSHGTRYEL